MNKMITKGINNTPEINFRSGEAILIDKPVDWTSFQVVYKIRKATGEKKIGHAGTLDPFATGLLIICTGKKTKEISNYQDLEKTYEGTILLGKKTMSMDTETDVMEEKSLDGITDEKIITAAKKFIGKCLQIPPMFSAVKYKGKALYKLARKGVTIERKPREIEIKRFEIKEINLPEVNFEITCSKGTYIRVIANDLGDELGCGGMLIGLRRTKIGTYSVENALSIKEFQEKFSNDEVLTVNCK